MRYPIAIEPRTDETAYGVVVPDLLGCFSAGDTLEEAIAGAEEAGLAWIETALDGGDPIPPPSPLEAIPRQAGIRRLDSFARHHRPRRSRRHGRARQYHASPPRPATARRPGACSRRDAIRLCRQTRDRPLIVLTQTAPPRPSTGPSVRPPTSRGGRARKFRPASRSPACPRKASSRSARRSRNRGSSRCASNRQS
jgi:predicted RNase H-like HicB family nuclease